MRTRIIEAKGRGVQRSLTPLTPWWSTHFLEYRDLAVSLGQTSGKDRDLRARPYPYLLVYSINPVHCTVYHTTIGVG